MDDTLPDQDRWIEFGNNYGKPDEEELGDPTDDFREDDDD